MGQILYYLNKSSADVPDSIWQVASNNLKDTIFPKNVATVVPLQAAVPIDAGVSSINMQSSTNTNSNDFTSLVRPIELTVKQETSNEDATKTAIKKRHLDEGDSQAGTFVERLRKKEDDISLTRVRALEARVTELEQMNSILQIKARDANETQSKLTEENNQLRSKIEKQYKAIKDYRLEKVDFITNYWDFYNLERENKFLNEIIDPVRKSYQRECEKNRDNFKKMQLAKEILNSIKNPAFEK